MSDYVYKAWRYSKSEWPSIAGAIFLLLKLMKMPVVYVYSRMNGFHVFHPKMLSKSSGQCYVLGSGGSVLELDTDVFERMSSGISIGFNYWIYHDFVPDVYVFEIKPCRPETFYHFCEILRVKEKDYKDVLFVIKDMELDYENFKRLKKHFPPALLPNVTISLDLQMASGTSEVFEASIGILKRLWSIMPFTIIPKCRGSLSYCQSMGWLFGVKETILCGVDLNNTTYMPVEFKSEKYSLPSLPSTRQEGNVIHSTNNIEVGIPTISQVLIAFQRTLFSSFGHVTSVANSKSALANDFPVRLL